MQLFIYSYRKFASLSIDSILIDGRYIRRKSYLTLSQQKQRLVQGDTAIDLLPVSNVRADPFVQLESNVTAISVACQEAQHLLEAIERGLSASSQVRKTLERLQHLDSVAAQVRHHLTWSFKVVHIADSPAYTHLHEITDTVQLYSDIWKIYEWNYHRAARIIFLARLITCATTAAEVVSTQAGDLKDITRIAADSRLQIEYLANDILATAPQSLGDIDSSGNIVQHTDGSSNFRAIGSYLLLWPIRIIRSEKFASTPEQKQRADVVFERMREYTGMKELLGDKSIIDKTQY